MEKPRSSTSRECVSEICGITGIALLLIGGAIVIYTTLLGVADRMMAGTSNNANYGAIAANP